MCACEEAEEEVVVPVEVPFGDVARLYGEPLEGPDHVRWGGEGCGGTVDDVHSTELELLEPRHRIKHPEDVLHVEVVVVAHDEMGDKNEMVIDGMGKRLSSNRR